MSNKKYYYLKLKEDFFDTDEMRVLESLDNGYLYSNILLKMYLKSLKYDGKLVFNEFIPFDSKMLSAITGHNIDIIEKAVKIFQSLHLIDIMDNGAIYMLDIQTLIGSNSDESIRKAKYREKIKLEKQLCIDGTMSQECPDIISISNYNSNSISNSLSNIPKEEINKEEKCNNTQDIKLAVAYLNEKTGSKYRDNTPETVRLLKKLLKTFTLDDIKNVIDKKCEEWKGTEYETYLRPMTLFGNKFEGYLNSKVYRRSQVGKHIEESLEGYDHLFG